MIPIAFQIPARAARIDDVYPVGFLNRPRGLVYSTRRSALMAVIIGAHALLAAWILSSGHHVAARFVPSLVAVDMSRNVRKPAASAKPAVEPPLPDDDVVAILSATLPVAPPAAGTGNGSGCSVANAIRDALVADQDAMAELAALPPTARSDADAVMLWNGAWLDTAPEAQAQMAPVQIPALRRAVIGALLALPVKCREVETAGPQLIPIPEPGRMTMVVIGSGLWRWSNLLAPPSDPATDGPADQAAGDWFAAFGLTGN